MFFSSRLVGEVRTVEKLSGVTVPQNQRGFRSLRGKTSGLGEGTRASSQAGGIPGWVREDTRWVDEDTWVGRRGYPGG